MVGKMGGDCLARGEIGLGWYAREGVVELARIILVLVLRLLNLNLSLSLMVVETFDCFRF